MGLVRSFTMKRKPTNSNISVGSNIGSPNHIGSANNLDMSSGFHSPAQKKLSSILNVGHIDQTSPGRKLSSNTGTDTTAGNNSNQKLKNLPTYRMDSEISPISNFFPVNRKRNLTNPNPVKIYVRMPPSRQNELSNQGFLPS
jgi:hypothetical protein